MNNHLLPFPYKQSHPQSWLERVLQPFSSLLFGEPTPSTPQEPLTRPIALRHHKDDLPPIRIICISDTHNAILPLPPGDILVHAGDLTAHGTFDEVQAQLRWLSSQPHTHKIVIAGNHDIILDEACDTKFPTRTETSAAKRAELDWGGIRYLHDEAITLQLPVPRLERQQMRRVKIYASPLTPEFGLWAFQYPPIRDVWTGRVPDDTDILVVHGPPALYGDCDGEKGPNGKVQVKGDGYLLREIRRVRPRMVICGHIHGAYGLAVIQHHGAQDVVNGLQMRWEGYNLLGALQRAIRSTITGSRDDGQPQETLVVNAAVAPGTLNSERKNVITVDYS
ncbi:Metallo-dependent phosphatase-like protein [Aspergillus floccosus]